MGMGRWQRGRLGLTPYGGDAVAFAPGICPAARDTEVRLRKRDSLRRQRYAGASTTHSPEFAHDARYWAFLTRAMGDVEGLTQRRTTCRRYHSTRKPPPWDR